MPNVRSAVPFALALFLLPSAATAQKAPLEGLNDYIEEAMEDWAVPGLAIAVIQGDSVIFARGYGVRTKGQPEPVDENTLFAIASTSKAFTTASLGMLVDEGKLDWDDPVTKYLPGFQLNEPYVTREITVRDLLTHRVGVSRSDNIWIAAPFDRDEILERARHLTTVDPFRAEYGYHNIMYIAAGEVVGAVSGSSWDEFVQSRIFRPLGMTRSTTRADVVETRENVSSSHTWADDEVQPVARRNYDNIGGAGAIFSSVSELSNWLRLHLNDGVFDGQRLLSEDAIQEIRTPQTIIGVDSISERLFPSTHFQAYGLGWVLQDYAGHKLVHHSGSINWTRTQLAMIPSEDLGVAIITNLGSSNLQRALMFTVLDALLGRPTVDWSAEYLALDERGDLRSEERAQEVEEAHVLGTTPSLATDDYTGTYTSTLYGDLTISRAGDHLVLEYAPDYVADLEHWHFDTFRGNWRRAGFGSDFVTFALNARGEVESLTLNGFGEFERETEG